MRLYKGAAPGLTVVEGLTSWSSSAQHAQEYADGRFLGFGGRCLYVAEVEVTRHLDLRNDLRGGLAEVALDLDDYPYESLHDLCRALAGVFRSWGYEWVAFRDRPEPDYDEWLYLGSASICVRPV